jgi:predicted alpha/beta superfamily hydrolase
MQMRFALASLLVLVAAHLPAQTLDGKITESIHSAVLGEDRTTFVHVPARLAPAQRAPVVYVLDAEANFGTVVHVLEDLGRTHPAASSVVVVGVGNIWSRHRDYTPTRIAASPHVDAQTAATTGGGRKFIAFLKTELIPHVEQKYPVSSKRILVGHSIGGLIGIEMLLNHREMFTHYIAIDPSMWWDGRRLLNTAQPIFETGDFNDRSLFLAIANVAAKNMDMKQLRGDTSEKTELSRPVVALADQVSATAPKGLRFEYRFYAQDDHMSVVQPGLHDGLKFVLEMSR